MRRRWVMVCLLVAGVALLAGCRPAGPATGQAGVATAVPTRLVEEATPTAAPVVAPTAPPAAPTTIAAPNATAPRPAAATGTPPVGGAGGGAMGAPANAVAASLGAAATVRVGQSVWAADAGVQAEVVDLLDSRCPQGVTCVRAGEVKVTVRVSEGGRELGTVTVASAPKEAQSKAVGGYTVTLLDVQPPKTAQETPKGDYVLTMRVGRG